MKVSIITPVYECDNFFRTYDSIKNQTNKDFEWIVVGDGKGLLNFIPEDDFPNKIKFAELYRNYGPSVARNVGFQISTGDIITYLDMGDELTGNRIQHIIEVYEAYPNVELMFDSYHIIQDLSNYFYNVQDYNRELFELYDIGLIDLLKRQNISIPLAVSHRRKPFVECGGFQPGIVCGEDGILWRRMSERVDKHNIMFTDFNAGNYYVSQTGQSRTQRRFEMGGFAFNGSLNDNGKYLDEKWFRNFSSKGLYEEIK